MGRGIKISDVNESLRSLMGGTVIFVDKDNWVLNNGKYTNTITVNGINPDISINMSIKYINDTRTEEQDIAYSLITDGITALNQVIINASEKPATSLYLILKGDVGTRNVDVGNFEDLNQRITGLTDNVESFRSQIEAISTSPEENELTNIRYGYDGTTYNTAGEAVRANDQALDEKIDNVKDELKEDLDDLNSVAYYGYANKKVEWELGGINGANGTNTSNACIRTKDYIYFEDLETTISVPNGYKAFLHKYLNETYKGNVEITSDLSFVGGNSYLYKIVFYNIADYNNNVPVSSIETLSENLNIAIKSNVLEKITQVERNCVISSDFSNKIDDSLFELGGINGANGTNVTSNACIRTKDYITSVSNFYLDIPDGYKVIAHRYFESNKGYVNNSTYTESVVLPYRVNICYKFVILKISDYETDVNIDNVKQISDNIGIYYNTTKKSSFVINVLGDSITSVDYTLPNWWQMLSSKYGYIFNNYGISGTCVGYNSYRETAFGKCFANRYSEMSNDADCVIVMGGTNDTDIPLGHWDDTVNSTFYGALNVLIRGLCQKYKGKTIIFMTPIQQADSYITNVINPLELIKNGSDSSVSLQLRAEAIKEKCKQYGIICIDLFNESGINGVDDSNYYYCTDDNTHPSIYGQIRISNILGKMLDDMIY